MDNKKILRVKMVVIEGFLNKQAGLIHWTVGSKWLIAGSAQVFFDVINKLVTYVVVGILIFDLRVPETDY